ncbi:hypothetical protein [Halorussus sp. AFM4]|uniref:hypothetical protein n=1 Tax=Halorussus sp. AFM4 TaxID=3421651 RepID=UPI003EBF52A7
MSENELQFENSIRSIYSLNGDAYVEDYRIRPKTVSDDRFEMSLLMRLGGPYATYYLRSRTVYSDDEDKGHRVEIRRRGGNTVDTFEVNWTTAEPDDIRDATQALHEIYIAPVNDWYSHALAADEADDR